MTERFLSLLAPEHRAAWLLPHERAEERRGPPVPPFDDLHCEARLWASWATVEERRIYLCACWNALPKRDREEFLATVGGKVAA